MLLAALAAWVLWQLMDWAFLEAIWAPNQNEACRTHDEGACRSFVTTRWRIVLFGLYQFVEQWRSGLARIVMLIVAILSCVSFFWDAKRLPLLWIAGFVTFYLLMRGGVFGLPTVVERDWGGLSLTVFVFAAVCLLGMPLAIVFALLRRCPEHQLRPPRRRLPQGRTAWLAPLQGLGT